MPSSSVADSSTMQYNVRTLQRHHKHGIHSHRAITKVVTDRLGDFSRSCSFDPEVVELWKFLRFRVAKYLLKPLHCESDRFAIAFPAIQEQDTCSYFSVVFITIVKPGNF